jgi:hypothetical protein
MLLADDTILNVGHEVIRLRGSLRAAFRLERQFRGFDKIVAAISDGNVSVMAAVIRECSDEKTDLADLLDSGGALSIRIVHEDIAGPLIAHVGILMGFDADAAEDQKQRGDPITFEEYHTRLFGLATGWLGWTPDEAWNATPAEITEAYRGRVEMLGAMFGTGTKDKPTTAKSNAATRRRLSALGDLTITNMASVPN